MKKQGLLVSMLCICMILTSCMLKIREDDNTKILNEVKQIKVFDYKLTSFQSTYDEYKKNTKELMTSYYNNKDDKVILAYDGKSYKGKDLVGMPLNELKGIGDKILIEFYGTTKIENCTVHISKVYYNENDTFKFRYVFTKENRKIGNTEIELYGKYCFMKENDKWKVTSISEISKTNEYKIDSRLLDLYTIYDNKAIEYVQTIDLLKEQ